MERTNQGLVRNMIGNQAGAGESHAQSEDRGIDQQPGIAETLTIIASRFAPADMVEPAPPIGATAIALCR